MWVIAVMACGVAWRGVVIQNSDWPKKARHSVGTTVSLGGRSGDPTGKTSRVRRDAIAS